MVIRKRRKKNKLRGNRTHGKGDTKRGRGGGSRGGRGKAGSKRHKKILFQNQPVKKKLKAKEKPKTISIGKLNKKIKKMEKEEKISKENPTIDLKKLGFEKILSNGDIEYKVKIINAQATEKAKEKIEKAGGSIEKKTIKKGSVNGSN